MWPLSVIVFSPTKSIIHRKNKRVVLDISKMALLPSHFLGLSSNLLFSNVPLLIILLKPISFKFLSPSPFFYFPKYTFQKLDFLYLFIWLHLILLWRRKWQPTPVFLPGESQRQESLVGCRLWGRTESDTTGRVDSPALSGRGSRPSGRTSG